jgi:hypothetical protein
MKTLRMEKPTHKLTENCGIFYHKKNLLKKNELLLKFKNPYTPQISLNAVCLVG